MKVGGALLYRLKSEQGREPLVEPQLEDYYALAGAAYNLATKLHDLGAKHGASELNVVSDAVGTLDESLGEMASIAQRSVANGRPTAEDAARSEHLTFIVTALLAFLWANGHPAPPKVEVVH